MSNYPDPGAGQYGQPINNHPDPRSGQQRNNYPHPDAGQYGQPINNYPHPGAGQYGQQRNSYPHPGTGQYGQPINNYPDPRSGQYGQPNNYPDPRSGQYGQPNNYPDPRFGQYGQPINNYPDPRFGQYGQPVNNYPDPRSGQYGQPNNYPDPRSDQYGQPRNNHPNYKTKRAERHTLSTTKKICISLLLLFGILIVVSSGIFLFTQTQGGATAQKPQQTQQASTSQTMPVGDIPGWHQIFTDDFTTNVPLGHFPGPVSNKWSTYPDGWKDSFKNGEYFPTRVVSIQNGVLKVHVHTENSIHMVAALEPKLPGAIGRGGGLLYGRYVMRFRTDPVAGYKIAGLLWPDSETWPRDGEIDFPECHLDGTMGAFMHRQNGTGAADEDAYFTKTTITAWHVATIEWTPNRITFMLDGATIGTSTTRIPDTPMHWILQVETTTAGPNNTAAGNFQIDWVTVYTPSKSTLTPRTPSSPDGALLTSAPGSSAVVRNTTLLLWLNLQSIYPMIPGKLSERKI